MRTREDEQDYEGEERAASLHGRTSCPARNGARSDPDRTVSSLLRFLRSVVEDPEYQAPFVAAVDACGDRPTLEARGQVPPASPPGASYHMRECGVDEITPLRDREALASSTARGLPVAALMLMPAVGALAADAQDTYLTSRDAYVARFSRDAGPQDEPTHEQESLALRDLEAQLRIVVGRVDIKGFSLPGRLSLETLATGYEDFGLLDGLVLSSQLDDARVLVTTGELLVRWLKDHKDWWKADCMPQDVEIALKSEAFYTQGIGIDDLGAAFTRYAEIPVTKPTGATFACALLGVRQQDFGLRTPDRLFVSVVLGKMVFVLSARTTAKITLPAACQRKWRLYEDARASGRAGFGTEEAAYSEFLRCFSRQTRRQRFHAALLAQAQALADRLRSR